MYAVSDAYQKAIQDNTRSYYWIGAAITLSFHLDIGDGVYEEVSMGVFEISEASRTIKRSDIKAYDLYAPLRQGFRCDSHKRHRL